MNNKEKILKYLSGLMPEGEKLDFEKELETSEKLNAELKNYRDKFSSLKDFSDIKEDNRYFSALLPKVRKKIDERENRYFPKLSIVSAFAVAILLIVILRFPEINRNVGQFDFSPNRIDEYLSQADSTELKELLESNFIYEYTTYHDNSFRNELGELSDDLVFNGAGYDYSSDSYFDNSASTELINSLSEEEIEYIYNSMLNQKIL